MLYNANVALLLSTISKSYAKMGNQDTAGRLKATHELNKSGPITARLLSAFSSNDKSSGKVYTFVCLFVLYACVCMLKNNPLLDMTICMKKALKY